MAATEEGYGVCYGIFESLLVINISCYAVGALGPRCGPVALALWEVCGWVPAGRGPRSAPSHYCFSR
jgi:hypothetical protein